MLVRGDGVVALCPSWIGVVLLSTLGFDLTEAALPVILAVDDEIFESLPDILSFRLESKVFLFLGSTVLVSHTVMAVEMALGSCLEWFKMAGRVGAVPGAGNGERFGGSAESTANLVR